MSKQTIGEFLATQRRAKGFTQQYVADLLGVSNRTLSAWETNKAYPDILMLPALAELYGVTSDEIIKGERNTVATVNESELSEKSQLKLFKSKLARNSSKYAALLSVGVCSAIAFTAGIHIIYSLRIDWLGILLMVLGLIATVTVFTLLIVFVKSAIASSGVYSESEKMPAENNFILNAVNQSVRVSDIIGAVWLLCGIVMGIALTAVEIAGYGYSTGTSFAGFMLNFGVPALIALIIFITANVIKFRTVKNCGTEEQFKLSKYNARLCGLCSISLIPFLAFAITITVLFSFPPFTKQQMFKGNEESFKNHMQSLIVKDSNIFDGLEIGIEKTLEIPENLGKEPQPVQDNVYARIVKDGNIEIFYCFKYNDKLIESPILYAEKLEIEGSEAIIYNVRYAGHNIKTEYSDGEYTLYEFILADVSESAYFVSLTAALASAAVGAVIYGFKRKKIKITI